MATSLQLCRLHYSMGSLTHVKALLKDLDDSGYIQHDAIPTKFFRSPYYYTLDRKGVRYLDQAGLDTSESFRASKEVNKHSLFVEHTLELNDILIACGLIHKDEPRVYLHSFMHERVLKKTPYKASWKAGGRTETFTVIPDAFLDFRLTLVDGRLRRMPILLEHDRGSEAQRHFRRRIRAYCVFLKTGAYQQLFATRAITVAFTTLVGPRRLEQMRDWTKQELASTGDTAAVGGAFLFASLSYPLEPRCVLLEPQWYTLQGQHPQPLLADERA